MSQWMGNLFFRKQSIEVIKKIRFAEMKEWNEWHKVMKAEEKKQAEGIKK